MLSDPMLSVFHCRSVQFWKRDQRNFSCRPDREHHRLENTLDYSDVVCLRMKHSFPCLNGGAARETLDFNAQSREGPSLLASPSSRTKRQRVNRSRECKALDGDLVAFHPLQLGSLHERQYSGLGTVMWATAVERGVLELGWRCSREVHSCGDELWRRVNRKASPAG